MSWHVVTPNSVGERRLRGGAAQPSTARHNADVRRHRGRTSRIGLVHLEPAGERLVAYLERRTPWDS